MTMMLMNPGISLSVVLVTLGMIIGTTNAVELDQLIIDEQWSHWKRVHNKQYTSDEEHDRRRGHWIRNLLTVMQHNVNYNLGLVTYSMGLNVFSDLSGNEFRDRYVNGYRSDLRKTRDAKSDLAIPFNMSEIGDIPESVDWRDHGLVVEVKDQGQCGSCWAFSTTGALEGQYAKKYGKQMEFSEQQLVDCTRRYGNHGCHGGSFEIAFEYLEKYGLEPEAVYPYEAHNEWCKYDGRKATVTVKSYSTLHSGNEQMLKAMVASHGPVSVGVDADQFQQYSGGIFEGPYCSTTHLNHAVLVVGYGSEEGVPYWIIKNSWSPEWGEKGYMRLIRDRGNTCGIATDASVPEIN